MSRSVSAIGMMNHRGGDWGRRPVLTGPHRPFLKDANPERVALKRHVDDAHGGKVQADCPACREIEAQYGRGVLGPVPPSA